MLNLFQNKKIIGLDIGTTSIKMAEINQLKGEISLVSFASVPTAPGAVSNGDILDVETVADSLRALMVEVGTKRSRASTSLSGSAVVVKKISIPQMDESLIAEQIRWEAEQYVPYDVNEVNLGFHILRGGSTAESMEILLIAGLQEAVYKYAEVLETAGAQCSVIDVAGFALANCFETNYGKAEGDSIALLNIGAVATNFVIVDNGEVIFCRDVPVGGATYTTEIQKSMSISAEEAEGMKISACNGFEAPEEVGRIIEQTHEFIIDEISSSIDFFLNTNSAAGISRGFVTGGCVKVPGVVEQLSKILPCERLDPFRSISYNPKVFSEDYVDEIRDFSAVAIGLSLRKVGDR